MNQAIQKRAEGASALAGTYRSAREVNDLMARAQNEANLVSPATSVGAMPEGCGIALTKVVVDVSRDEKGKFFSNDTYSTGAGDDDDAKRGLSKTVLQKIGAALGVSWDPLASGRLDDGRDPYYCHWRSVGTYRAFDGQVQHIVGEKEMDLREGSAQVQALWERYNSKLELCKRKNWKLPNPPTGQIREMRLHILGHAETKAQLRAIRSLGIKTSYTVEELKKPFVCARIMWTGQTDDPELRRLFAEKQADAFLGGTRSLFGRPESFAPSRGGPAPLKLTGAPPVGSVALDEDDDGHGHGESAVPQQQPQQRQAEPEPARAEAKEQGEPKPRTSKRGAGASAGPTLPAGDSQGKPLSEAAEKDLKYWSNRLERGLQEGTSRFPKQDEELLDAVHDELARRAEATGEDRQQKF